MAFIISALTIYHRREESFSTPSAERAIYVIANLKSIKFAYYASVSLQKESFYFATWMEKMQHISMIHSANIFTIAAVVLKFALSSTDTFYAYW